LTRCHPDAITVVVPAHDEQGLLPACLGALGAAAGGVAGLPVRVVVVADDCRDTTARVARAHGALVLQRRDRNVGAARRAGMALALRRAPVGPDRLWLATTDADSEVPSDWLSRQLRHAGAGADAVAGTVLVASWAGHHPGLAARYEHYYRRGSRHVHGANLGVRADAYLSVGGFRPLPLHEDRSLIENLDRAGHRVVYATDLPVRTSARRHARARGGFADHLVRLAAGDESGGSPGSCEMSRVQAGDLRLRAADRAHSDSV
jgi:glycosyltransferase involved in cell wall biosynthesis